MKKKIVCILMCMLMLLSVPAVQRTVAEPMSTPTLANQDPQLVVWIVGSLRLLGIDRVGGAIGNTGDTTAHNVSYYFTVDGGFDDSIHFTSEDYLGDIQANHGIGLVFQGRINGFGPIILTLTATSSNTDDVTEDAKGFQIGYFTLVFGL